MAIYAGTRDGKNYGFYISTEGLTDYVEISEEEHRELLNSQTVGKVIAFHKGAKPTLEDAPEPTAEEKLKSEKRKLMKYPDETDYIVTKCVEQGLDIETEYAGVKAKRQAARDRINEIEALLSESSRLI
jgi:hypothetical protein